MLTTIPPGNPAYQFAVCDVMISTNNCIFSVQGALWCGSQYVACIVDGNYKITYLNCTATSPTSVIVPIDITKQEHQATVIPLGQWSYIPDGYDVAAEQYLYIGAVGKSVLITFDAVITNTTIFGDAQQFSSISLTGAIRQTNVQKTDMSTRGSLNITLTTNTAGIHILNLFNGPVLVATGSRTGDGVIAFTPVNSSGISGSLTLTYSADITTNCYMDVRWAQQYNFTLDSAPSITVYDDGVSNSFSGTILNLTAGSHLAYITAIDDLGNTSSTSAPIYITVPGTPIQASNLAYVSGNASSLVLSFTPSITGGATYRVYKKDCGVNDLMNFESYFTASTTPITITGIADYPGTARFLLKAVSGGLEDVGDVYLDLEFDASGNIVNKRPNIPQGTVNTEVSRTLTIGILYDTLNQPIAPATFQLFVVSQYSTVNWSSPSATGAAPAASADGYVRTSLNYAVSSDGWYFWALRAVSLAGTPSSNTTLYGPVWLGNAAPPAPSNIDVQIIA